MALDLIPLNFPLGCGPGPDPSQFPPGCGPGGGFPWQGGLLGERGVSLAGGSPWQGVSLAGGSPWWGVLLGRGVSLAGGSPWQEGLPGRGGSPLQEVLPGRLVSLAGGCIPACTEADPPVNRMTDACENITLPQTSFAGGNKRLRLNFCCILY